MGFARTWLAENPKWVQCGRLPPAWSAVTCHRFRRANLFARDELLVTLPEGEMNFALKGGDESPHSMSERVENKLGYSY